MEDYKARLQEEYRELKERHGKLCRKLEEYDAGEFTPRYPITLLRMQEAAMLQYLNALEIRAAFEGIEL